MRFPFTVTILPLVVGLSYGAWGPAVGTYIIFPILMLALKLLSKAYPED